MQQSLWIPGPLPGTNEMLAACRKRRGKGSAYSQLKAKWTADIATLARSAKLTAMIGTVRFEFFWLEPNRKRDPDNIHAAVKFCMDGLVAAGVLADDTQKTIGRIEHHPIEIDAKEPGVTVEMEDLQV